MEKTTIYSKKINHYENKRLAKRNQSSKDKGSIT